MKKALIFCTAALSLFTLPTQQSSAQAKKTVAKKAVGGGDVIKRTKTGLEYKIIKKTPAVGVSPKLGDYVEMNIKVHVGDSMLFDSRKVNGGKPVYFPIQKPTFTSDPVQGFMMMKAGDSAVFYVRVDSLKSAGQNMPPWINMSDKLQYDVKLVSVTDAVKGKAKADKLAAEAKVENEKRNAVARAEAEQHAKAQLVIDDKILTDYFTQNHISATKTASGLYYTITSQGAGDNAHSSQTVTVNYTGKTLDGKTFDSNIDSNFHHVTPFTFTLGKHQVIEGWDEGIPMIKKGGKGTLYIPSPMAYGERSPAPSIPANGILVFDVEVTDVK